MDVGDLVTKKRDDIIHIATEHGAHNVRIFGSVASGEADAESDLDLLVEMESGRSLLDHIALLQDLEDLLGCKVDVVSEKALHWYIRDRILKEAIPI
jgi:predicted nucleotidyltransferase